MDAKLQSKSVKIIKLRVRISVFSQWTYVQTNVLKRSSPLFERLIKFEKKTKKSEKYNFKQNWYKFLIKNIILKIFKQFNNVDERKRSN